MGLIVDLKHLYAKAFKEEFEFILSIFTGAFAKTVPCVINRFQRKLKA